MDDSVKKLQAIIDKSSRIVFFGGAGVSTESGIPDFRSVDGLYHQKFNYPPETILSYSFYKSHKSEFFDFYRSKILHLEAMPNEAHKKLAQLEKAGRLTAVVTQNIDGLHQKAGSIRVIELHGSVHRNLCGNCGCMYEAQFMQESTGIPQCTCGGDIKPDVVLYEENLNHGVLEEAVKVLSQADTLIIGGTSLAVYPAAGLVDYFKGSNLVIINRGELKRARQVEGLFIDGSIGEVMGRLTV